MNNMDTTTVISDAIKINSDDIIYVNKDSTLFLSNLSNVTLSLLINNKWITRQLPYDFNNSKIEISYNDFNNDKIPEIIFKIVNDEHITYGDTHTEYLAIFDYNKMFFLFKRLTNSKSSHYSYNSKKDLWNNEDYDYFNLPIKIEKDKLIIGKAEGEIGETKIAPGTYKLTNNKWCPIDQ